MIKGNESDVWNINLELQVKTRDTFSCCTLLDFKELRLSLQPDDRLRWSLDQNVAFFKTWTRRLHWKFKNWTLLTCDSFSFILSHISFWTVCRIANKNCRLVYDIWQRCWDSEQGEVPRGGVGLMSGWYDACAGMLIKEYCLLFVIVNNRKSCLILPQCCDSKQEKNIAGCSWFIHVIWWPVYDARTGRLIKKPCFLTHVQQT